MSRIVPATCEGGVVMVGELAVDGATIFSEGVGSSDGLLLMQGEDMQYIAKVTPDIKTLIIKSIDALEDMAAAVNEITTVLTSIGAGMTGPTTAPPPTLAVDVASIITWASQITATRAELITLKDGLK